MYPTVLVAFVPVQLVSRPTSFGNRFAYHDVNTPASGNTCYFHLRPGNYWYFVWNSLTV
jgi:hypothetical protein